MAFRKKKEEVGDESPPTSLLDDLEGLLPKLEEATVPGVYPEFVRHALNNVAGAVKHLHDARWQDRVLPETHEKG